MVVPLSKSLTDPVPKTRRIIGDGKRIVLRTNSDSLLVIGSGNSVEVERNDGNIQVIGDGCRVSVIAGSGTIEYNGDGGYLHAGTVDLSHVTYKGDGGRVVSSQGPARTYSRRSTPTSRSAEDVRAIKVTGGNIVIRNQSKCQVTMPGTNNALYNIRVPVAKFTVLTCKCKHSSS